MFINNLYLGFSIEKELMYVTSKGGGSRRYHLFNFGFDHFCRNNGNGSAWCINLTIPFVSVSIGYVFKNK